MRGTMPVHLEGTTLDAMLTIEEVVALAAVVGCVLPGFEDWLPELDEHDIDRMVNAGIRGLLVRGWLQPDTDGHVPGPLAAQLVDALTASDDATRFVELW